MAETEYEWSLHCLVYLPLSERSELILDSLILQRKTNPEKKFPGYAYMPLVPRKDTIIINTP